jgi:hypothetical protein
VCVCDSVCVCELNVSSQEKVRRCLILSDAEGRLPKQDSDRVCEKSRETQRGKRELAKLSVCVCVCVIQSETYRDDTETTREREGETSLLEKFRETDT